MKVNSGKGSTNVELQIQKTAVKKSQEHVRTAPKPTDSGDKVQISRAGSEIARAKEVINNQPDVRVEKVRQAKRQVDEGTYKVDSGKVADKIVRENILDEIL